MYYGYKQTWKYKTNKNNENMIYGINQTKASWHPYSTINFAHRTETSCTFKWQHGFLTTPHCSHQWGSMAIYCCSMAVTMWLQHGIHQPHAAWPPYNQKMCPSKWQHGHILMRHGSKSGVTAWHKSNTAAWPPYNQKLCPSMRQHGQILLQHGSKYVVAAWHKSNNSSMASLQP